MATHTDLIEKLAARFAAVAAELAVDQTVFGDDLELIGNLERVIVSELKHYAERLAQLVKVFAHSEWGSHV